MNASSTKESNGLSSWLYNPDGSGSVIYADGTTEEWTGKQWVEQLAVQPR